MFIVYEMLFEKTDIPSPEIECISLTGKALDEYREQYKEAYNAAFRPMREALGIRPYDWFSEGGAEVKYNPDVFLLIIDGELAGSVACYGDEIDDLFVSDSFRNKGYGRKLLVWAMNYLFSRGYREVWLNVAEWNEHAVQMYLNAGFVIVRKVEMQNDK